MDSVCRNESGTGLLDWAVACRPLGGGPSSGDAALVVEASGRALLAVIDALGHGPAAEVVARDAMDELSRDPGLPLVELIERVHRRLAGGRGAAVGLAHFRAEERALRWLAVGNVEGVLWHADGRGKTSLPARPGVVGWAMRAVQPKELELRIGDVLVVATDGLWSGFAEARPPPEGAPRVAARMLAEFERGTDDALVAVARYRGTP